MKKITLALGIFGLLSACQSNDKPAESQGANAAAVTRKLEATILKNYFLLNTVEVKERQCWLLNGQAEFDAMVGMAKTAKNELIIPNFDTSFVAAIAVPPADRLTDIRVSRIEKNGDTARVHFEVIEGTDKLTWVSQPFLLFSFPKSPDIHTVTFVQTGVKISSFPAPSAGAMPMVSNAGFTNLPNHFVKTNAKADQSPQFLVIADAKSLEENLITPKSSMKVTPDFTSELVLGVVLPETKKPTEVKFVSVTPEGEDLKVVFTVLEGIEQAFSTRPSGIIKVQRGAAKTVTFYRSDKKLKTVAVPQN